jgi:hypothetical protein
LRQPKLFAAILDREAETLPNVRLAPFSHCTERTFM